MSAYIVDNVTIDRIVTWIEDRMRIIFPVLYDRLMKEVRAPFYNREDAIGLALLAMNVRAVNERYRETNPVPAYRYVCRGPVTDIQALKSLQCLRYQCSEGSVPESKLYTLINDIISDLAQHIVSFLPQYEAAEWG